MDEKDIKKLVKKIRHERPLIHHITNEVTINDCANITLALGASPIMAKDPMEVKEVTALSKALVLNMGMLSKRNLGSMILSGEVANELGIPVVLDPVGIGVSSFRIKSIEKVLEKINISIIKGNSSEIKTICQIPARNKGVDSMEDYSTESMKKITRDLSNQLNATIVCSGETDIISFRNQSISIKGGNKILRNITGTGCMLTSLIGAYISVMDKAEEAALAGILSMNMAGERAYKLMVQEKRGIGSFKVFLLDEIYLL